MRYYIPISKVKAVVTDNGSNMVRAFKEHIMVTDEEEEQDDSEEDSGQEEQEHYCGLEEMGDQQEGEEENNQRIHQEKEIGCLAVAEGSGDAGLSYDPDSDAEDFADREHEHVLAFEGMTRLSCFAHTVQLVLLKFNKDKRVAAVLKKATSVVKKFNMSKNATEQLVNEAGVKLLGVCPTRWSSTYLVIERLLRVREFDKGHDRMPDGCPVSGMFWMIYTTS